MQKALRHFTDDSIFLHSNLTTIAYTFCYLLRVEKEFSNFFKYFLG
jgi:hypothetical protein